MRLGKLKSGQKLVLVDADQARPQGRPVAIGGNVIQVRVTANALTFTDDMPTSDKRAAGRHYLERQNQRTPRNSPRVFIMRGKLLLRLQSHHWGGAPSIEEQIRDQFKAVLSS